MLPMLKRYANYGFHELHFYKPARSLRSQSAALIEMPKNARTKIYGERRFDVAAGNLCNSLPASLRNEQSLEAFKKGLKTHLFKIAFVKSRSIDLDL